MDMEPIFEAQAKAFCVVVILLWPDDRHHNSSMRDDGGVGFPSLSMEMEGEERRRRLPDFPS